MSTGNMYDNYKEQAVNTMTAGELLVLLYDEVIKRLNRAKIFLKNDNKDAFDGDIKRARDIIQYFEQSLDRSIPISRDLHRLYDFMLFELSRSQASRTIEPIDEILPMLAELRDTWKEADRLCRINQ